MFRRVAVSDVAAVVAELEPECRILSVDSAADGTATIYYEPKVKRSAPGEVETR